VNVGTEQQQALRGPRPVAPTVIVGLVFNAVADVSGMLISNPKEIDCFARRAGPSTILDILITIVPLSGNHVSMTKSENKDGAWRTDGDFRF